MAYSGGCCCGAVRYEVSGPARDETSCHCSLCRRTSGAPFLAWFTVSREHFRVLAGEPTRFDSSPDATRSFCAACGTQLTFESRERDHEIDVTTASLDQPEALPPRDHTFVRSRLSWVATGKLPTYPAERE